MFNNYNAFRDYRGLENDRKFVCTNGRIIIPFRINANPLSKVKPYSVGNMLFTKNCHADRRHVN